MKWIVQRYPLKPPGGILPGDAFVDGVKGGVVGVFRSFNNLT
jgi:hypothetical protein